MTKEHHTASYSITYSRPSTGQQNDIAATTHSTHSLRHFYGITNEHLYTCPAGVRGRRSAGVLRHRRVGGVPLGGKGAEQSVGLVGAMLGADVALLGVGGGVAGPGEKREKKGVS